MLANVGSALPSTPELCAAAVAAGTFVASLPNCAPCPCWMYPSMSGSTTQPTGPPADADAAACAAVRSAWK